MSLIWSCSHASQSDEINEALELELERRKQNALEIALRNVPAEVSHWETSEDLYSP